MLQNTSEFAPLFTFAPQKLEALISKQKYKKFPFLHRGKIKAIGSAFKMKTQEVQQEEQNELKANKTQQDCPEEVGQHFNQQAITDKNKTGTFLMPENIRINLPRLFDNGHLLKDFSNEKRSISCDRQGGQQKKGGRLVGEKNSRYRQRESDCLMDSKLRRRQKPHDDSWMEQGQKREEDNQKSKPSLTENWFTSPLLQRIRRLKQIYG